MARPWRANASDRHQLLWIAQEGRCALCGEAMPVHRFELAHATLWKKYRPTLDHIRPRARGGGEGADNLQLAHAICNWRKGSGSPG